MKKEAKEAIRVKLQTDMNLIRRKLISNRYAMKKLVDEQTQLKRERVIYQELIRSLDPSPKALPPTKETE